MRPSAWRRTMAYPRSSLAELGARAQPVECATLHGEADGRGPELAGHAALERLRIAGQGEGERRAIGHGELGRGRWRGRPHVSRKVCQRHVGLVSDAGDNRQRVGDDRSDHALVVERPEVLEGSTSPREDRGHRRICDPSVLAAPLRPAFHPSERPHDALRRPLALDETGREHDLGQRPAPAQDCADVVPDRPRRAGDDRDGRRAFRQRPLPSTIKQAFGGEACLRRLELECQVPESGRLQVNHVQLVDALGVEHVDAPVSDHAEPGLRLEGLEREVAVPRGRDRHPADLSLNPHVAQPVVPSDCLPYGASDFADRQNPEPEPARRRDRRRGGRRRDSSGRRRRPSGLPNHIDGVPGRKCPVGWFSIASHEPHLTLSAGAPLVTTPGPGFPVQ